MASEMKGILELDNCYSWRYDMFDLIPKYDQLVSALL